MKTYIKFIITLFYKSFLYVFLLIFCLVFILNILNEIEFFNNIENISSYFPIYLSLLNSPSLIFEVLPFITLLSTQLFFINLLKDNQIQVFKYSGLKNSKILIILSYSTFFLGIFLILVFYNFSSKLKNIYLELKNNYSSDDKYLAVVTKNGLWIKDTIGGKINIINARKIDQNFLIDSFITQFDNKYQIEKNIQSPKIDISKNKWEALDSKIYINNESQKLDSLIIFSNFNYNKIQSLFSNLSSMSIIKLLNLRKNYLILNYSITEVDLQLAKVIAYPIYLVLMSILSSIIMFNTKKYRSTTFKISIGLFFSVFVYYINNFFFVMGKTEKISITVAVFLPILFLTITNILLLNKINEK